MLHMIEVNDLKFPKFTDQYKLAYDILILSQDIAPENPYIEKLRHQMLAHSRQHR